MTSQISLRNLLKKEIRQTIWLPVLIGIIGVFGYPLRYLSLVQAVMENRFHGVTGTTKVSLIREITVNTLGSGDPFTLIALTVAAVLCAVISFAYMDSRERVDLYHAMPLLREKLYGVAFFRGWLSAVIPYFLCIVIAFTVVGIPYGAWDTVTVGQVFGGIALHILAFTVVYAVAVLAMILTGRLLTGILMSLFLLGYGPACYLLAWELIGMNYYTYWNHGSDLTYPVRFLSPMVGVSELGTFSFGREGYLLPPVLTLAIWGVAAILLGVLLYKKRPSEAAENAMAWPILERIIKVAVIVPSALFIGLIMRDAGNGGAGWFVGGVLIGAVLINGIMEFIYMPDLRNMFRHWKSGLAGIGAAAAVMIILVTDPAGYDRWLPEQNEIEAMGMADLNSNSWVYGQVYIERTDVLQDEMKERATENFAPIYALAQEGVAHARWDHGDEAEEATLVSDEDVYTEEASVVVYYRLKNGKEVFRQYWVSQESLCKSLRVLVQDPRQAELLYPVNQLVTENLHDLTLGFLENPGTQEETYISKELDLSSSEIGELVAALRRDTERAGVDLYTRSSWVADLMLSYADGRKADKNGPYYITSLSVYEEYTETLAWLNERGYSLTAGGETR